MALVLMKQRYVDQILAGTKTSTIRPWAVCRVRVGGPISFNGRQHATCTAIERRRLKDLSLQDVRADGFADYAAFERSFLALYPYATPDTLVWVIRFAVNDSAQSARASVASDQGGAT